MNSDSFVFKLCTQIDFPSTACPLGKLRVAHPTMNPEGHNAPVAPTPPNRIRTEIDYRRWRELLFSPFPFSPDRQEIRLREEKRRTREGYGMEGTARPTGFQNHLFKGGGGREGGREGGRDGREGNALNQ